MSHIELGTVSIMLDFQISQSDLDCALSSHESLHASTLQDWFNKNIFRRANDHVFSKHNDSDGIPFCILTVPNLRDGPWTYVMPGHDLPL